jgi:hypothetical protein
MIMSFEFCGYLYNGYWRFIWLLILELVELIEIRTSWPEHPR